MVGALDSQRGGRRHGGLIDEIRDHDEKPINEIVLPLMNVSRRLPNGEVNLNEPNQQVLSMTSAGVKTSFAYDMLIDKFEKSIIDPVNNFCIGFDYRVPVLHGLIDKNFIRNLKMSPSYNENSFAREYLSLWSGASDDSWFQYDRLTKYRKLKNPEWKPKNRAGVNQFYLISVDVGRIHDQTVVSVFRVNIQGNGRHLSSLVNIIVLGKVADRRPFAKQAIDIKKLIEIYNPKEVVIDTNGLGVGLGDEMVETQVDEQGNFYPSYGFINDDDYKKTQPKDSIKILYSFKANSSLKAKIHSNAYQRLSSGAVKFLIKEQEAKNALLATKVGSKMKIEDRVKRLMPHEMTTKLFEEMANLRLKKTSSTDIVLEQINTRYPDDKYMSFAYGLWRIRELEETYQSKRRRRGLGGKVKSWVFYTGDY